MAWRKVILAASLTAIACAAVGIGYSSGDKPAVAAIRPASLAPLMSESRSGRALVPRGDLLVLKRGRLQVMSQSGRVIRRLRRFHGAAQAMAISADRRHAFIGMLKGDLAPEVDEVDLATGQRVKVGDGISPAVSQRDGRLAYLAVAVTQDVHYLTALVVQSADMPPHQIPMGSQVPLGTPPDVVINWSPDGRRIAMFDLHAVRLVDPTTAASVGTQPAIPGRSFLAPAFLSSKRLVGLTNCCIGRQRLSVVNPTTGKRSRFAVLPAPPENIGRVHHGLLFAVTALRQLVLARKGKVQIIVRGVAAAAA